MSKQMNIPQLRFPEFKGDWERKKLGEVATITTGSTPSTVIPEYYNGEKLFVSPADLQGNRFVMMTKTTLSELGFSKGRKITKGSVLFVCIGSTIGKVGIANEDCLTNQQINALNSKVNFENDFIFTTLEKNGREIKLLAGVQAVPQINKTDFSNLSFSFPTLPEQTRIASFFTVIDQKIAQLKQKKKLLEEYKKGVMQKLFSQELRFKDDNGKDFPEWEKKKLGEVLNIPEKVKPNKIEKSKLLTVKLHLKGLFKNESTDGLSIGSTNYFVRTKGQFIYGKQNLFNGAFGVIPDEFDGFLTSSDVPALDINYSKMNSIFLLNFLGREIFYKKLEEIASGSGSKRIHENTLLNVEISIPSLPEQNRIANFLSSIDEKITNVELRITNTETWKKGLLQKMFC